ncbi:hypothetical protein HYW59_05045 [Candidatus Kaiserbacteria bacterium]|nr:hypothetical protein [Candidatus Kaiserbacteria bacterium]
MKVKARELTKEDRILVLDALYTAAATVKGRAAMKLFLRDLLTESERIMLGRRILIARRLIAGETFEDINDVLHVGRDTVWKVQRWLQDQFPGYEKAIKDMEVVFAERKRKFDDKRLYATSALYRLKKKYPLHFLLFPWPKIKD